jgi:hypothetical protein
MRSNGKGKCGRGTLDALRAAASVSPTDDFDAIICRLQVDDVFTLLGPGPLELVSPTARAFINDCCRFDDPAAFTSTHTVQRVHREWAARQGIPPLTRRALFAGLHAVAVLDRLKRGPDPGQTGWKRLRVPDTVKPTSMPNEFVRQTVGSLVLTKEAAARLREFRLRLGTTNSDVVERLIMRTRLPRDLYGRGQLPDDPPDREN